MLATEFAEFVIVNRKSITSFDKFKKIVTEADLFDKLIDSINNKTIEWGKSVGLIDRDDSKDKHLSSKEREWKSFFENHSFDSNNEQRNLADALSLATGIDITRFMLISKQTSRNLFSPWICLVPLRNNSGHNYHIGEPMLKFQGSSSNVFVKSDGRSGNNMDSELTSIRLADKTEIEDLIINIFWTASGTIESIILSILV